MKRFGFLGVLVFILMASTVRALPGLEEIDGQYYFETKDGGKVLAAYGKAFADSYEVLKMGPAGIHAPLEIYPFEGGIEGHSPVNGSVRLLPQIKFLWGGANVRGSKPSLFVFENGSMDHKQFRVESDQKGVSIPAAKMGLKHGREYRWYLGHLRNGKPIAQSRVFRFHVLSKKEESDLNRELRELKETGVASREGTDFLRAQVYYEYRLYHDMVILLQPLYNVYPTSESLGRLLYLGYVKIGKRVLAKTLQNKLTQETFEGDDNDTMSFSIPLF